MDQGLKLKPSRRSFLLATAAVAASPAAAVPAADDRDLLDLCAEISRLRGEADVIDAERVWPLEQEIQRILCGAGTRRERMDAADAYAVRSGLREVRNEVGRMMAQAGALTERVLELPARTPAARWAKADAILGHLAAHGWEAEDPFGFRALRAALLEFTA